MDSQTILYSLIAVAQVGVIVWYIVSTVKKRKKVRARKDELSRQYPFEGMRHIALNMVPGAVLANVPADEVLVYAVLMDWDMGNDVVTLVTQITGEANLYVKSGGGIIGAGKYLNVSDAAQNLVNVAQRCLPESNAASATSLPTPNHVQFFMLTNRGKFYMMDDIRNIESKQSPLLPLFEAANMVIGQMRQSAMHPAE